jgi:hypothetical protein
MARFTILAEMFVVPRPVPIGEADTPADAVRKAREFAKQGKRDVQIGDSEVENYFPLEQFAAKHGIR